METTFSLAVIHDWLTARGGAEKVLESFLEIFPQAPIYTLVYSPEIFRDHPLHARQITTSFIQKLPWAEKRYRQYLPLMPLAIEQFDLRGFDIVFSSSDAVAHGVLTSPDQVHVNYIYTPVRYAWRMYHDYLHQANLRVGLRSAAVRVILHYLRLWDYAASGRVDHFVTISNWVARSVWQAYRRPAEVIYPPVEVEKFQPLSPRGDYYITVSRLVTNKRIELLVQAFEKFPYSLIVIGDGPARGRLSAIAPPNVKFLGWQSQSAVQEMLGRAKAYVHAAEEEFGITLVEALASGCPVIAYRRGGVLEIVDDGVTGLLFPEQTVESIREEIERFERKEVVFEIARMRSAAERFRKQRFQSEIAAFLEKVWGEHKTTIQP